MSFRVPYRVGTTLGRDHINWPTIVRSEIDGIFGTLTEAQRDRIWPVDITLKQMLGFAWRVRKWRFSGSATATTIYTPPGPSPTVTTTVGDATIAADTYCYPLHSTESETNIPATKEIDLLRREFTPRYRALVGNGISAPDSTPIISEWNVHRSDGFEETDRSNPTEINAVGTFVLFDPDTKLFAPPVTGLGLGGLIPDLFIPSPWGGSALFIMGATFHRNPQTVIAGPGPLIQRTPAKMTVKMGAFVAPDFDVPMELFWRNSGEDDGSTIDGEGSADFTLEAVEFWPYVNSLAQPVYDVNDGHQLNDPHA